MSRALTTYQAWMKIARAYEKASVGQLEWLGTEEDGLFALGAVGFCGAILTLHRRGEITQEQYRVMGKQIDEALKELKCITGSYCRPSWLASCTTEGAELRVILAVLHAELSR